MLSVPERAQESSKGRSCSCFVPESQNPLPKFILCEIYNSIITKYFFTERTTYSNEGNAVFMTYFFFPVFRIPHGNLIEQRIYFC